MNPANVDFPITNQYTFSYIFSNPKHARPLLEAVLGMPIGEIHTIEPEHTIQPSLRSKGVRMDVFADDGSGAVYDVEMQNANEGDLELRSRYLLSSFDRDRIAHGDDYLKLGRSVVVFVCAFDPIGLGEPMYVVRPTVLDHWQVYDDGTMRIFLNTKGASDPAAVAQFQENPRVASFLSYCDGGGTMGDEWLESIDEDVRALNADEGWRNTVLGLQLDYEHARYLAREAGLADGRREGLAEGREAGLAEGREAGLAEGREAGLAEGREAGLAEGREAGLAEGREESDRTNRQLAEALRAAGRSDELMDAMLDSQKRASLLEEFGIR